MILSNIHEGVDTIDWLKTFKQAYHINLRFDRIRKLKQLLIKDHLWSGHTNLYIDYPNHYQHVLEIKTFMGISFKTSKYNMLDHSAC